MASEPEISDNDAEVGLTVAFKINSETQGAILQSIRRIDKMATVATLPADAGLQAIRDYATKPAFKMIDGVRKKVRDPLADSLEDYLKGFIRTGKVKWNTVLDKRTGSRDRDLDGTIWDANDPAAPLPPLHSHCRCWREPIPDQKGAYSG